MWHSSILNARIQSFFSKPGMHNSMQSGSMAVQPRPDPWSYSIRRLRKSRFR